MEPDEAVAIVCTGMLPFCAALMGATETTIIVVTIWYVASAIAVVKYKHYLRRRDR